MTFEAGQSFAHFRIIRKLGEGGMGEVYLAEDQKLGREIALKILRSEFFDDQERLNRFIREARTAAKISHPNVASIHDIGSEKYGASGSDVSYIVMEYVDGECLTDYMKSRSLGIAEILRIAEKIASGLASAHKQGIVHRDIKGDNIIVNDSSDPKILDFGLAKPIERPLADADVESTNTVSGDLTQEGKILGTVAYMSPEQARGDSVDSRSDIFSFGILLYRMVTGEPPFEGKDRVSVLAKILEVRHSPVRDRNTGIPAELERIIDKCLHKDPNDRYQDTRDLAVDLRNLRRQYESGITDTDSVVWDAAHARDGKKRVLKAGKIGFALLALIAVVFVLTKYSGFFDSSEAGGLQAGESRLAVMYFENLAEPGDSLRLGEIITNLLIADLSESDYVQVVSSQRLFDILKQLGREDTKNIDREIASQVARTARASWMLMGSILQIEPEIVLTTQLVEVASGNVVGSERLTGEPNEKVFSLVDKLTVEIKKDLSLPSGALAEDDPLVGDITTRSAEAYRYYLEGRELIAKHLHDYAQQSFQKAIEIDSTFAMAYYGLSLTNINKEAFREAVGNAVRYMERASNAEQLYILARQQVAAGERGRAMSILDSLVSLYPEEKDAYYRLAILSRELYGTDERYIDYLNKVIVIDPLYKEAYNSLAYAYDKIGDFERSIWAINKYIDIAPDDANPYDTRAELYAANGMLGEAAVSYRKSIELNPEFFSSYRGLGYTYLYMREYAKAESVFQVIVVDDDKYERNEGRLGLARLLAYQGRFRDARRMYDIGIEADRMEKSAGSMTAMKAMERAILYAYTGHADSAWSEIRGAVERVYRKGENNPTLVFQQIYEAHYCGITGDTKVADSLEVEMYPQTQRPDADPTAREIGWITVGFAKFAKGEYDSSLVLFRNYADIDRSFLGLLMIARCNLALGRLGEAVAAFEAALNRYDEVRPRVLVDAVKTHYWLGNAYERSGWTAKAIDQYQTFLDIWKDADGGIFEVDDARQRLSTLKNLP